jgi:hypothetical protein
MRMMKASEQTDKTATVKAKITMKSQHNKWSIMMFRARLFKTR